jgi:hypothetical protein
LHSSALSNFGDFTIRSINLKLHLSVKLLQHEGSNFVNHTFDSGQSPRLSPFVFKALSQWEIGSMLLGDSSIGFMLFGTSKLEIGLCMSAAFGELWRLQKSC